MHGCYQLESYKELPHPLSYLLILVFFLGLLEAMNESALDKLKRKAKKKKLDRKAEPTRKKQVEKEKNEICLFNWSNLY